MTTKQQEALDAIGYFTGAGHSALDVIKVYGPRLGLSGEETTEVMAAWEREAVTDEEFLVTMALAGEAQARASYIMSLIKGRND